MLGFITSIEDEPSHDREESVCPRPASRYNFNFLWWGNQPLYFFPNLCATIHWRIAHEMTSSGAIRANIIKRARYKDLVVCPMLGPESIWVDSNSSTWKDGEQATPNDIGFGLDGVGQWADRCLRPPQGAALGHFRWWSNAWRRCE